VPLIFGLDDCTLFKAQTEHQDITGWRITLRSDWGGSYPKFFTACTAQTVNTRAVTSSYTFARKRSAPEAAAPTAATTAAATASTTGNLPA
jgi:hypothetical protein